MQKQLPAWAALCIISIAAGLLLGLTNEVTAGRIAEQMESAADAARRTVLPGAEEFVEQTLDADSAVDSCYMGSAGSEPIGYTAQKTVKGYGGEIEVTVGIDINGRITGVSVGGAGFAETAGLGSKAKDAAFQEQFRGVNPPAVAGENVDGITGATITTGAVLSAVNGCAEFIQAEMLGA